MKNTNFTMKNTEFTMKNAEFTMKKHSYNSGNDYGALVLFVAIFLP
jgi:hypothetical protein